MDGKREVSIAALVSSGETNALLVDGFRCGGQEGDKLYYKTVNAGGENEYEMYVRLSNEVNDVSYMR